MLRCRIARAELRLVADGAEVILSEAAGLAAERPRHDRVDWEADVGIDEIVVDLRVGGCDPRHLRGLVDPELLRAGAVVAQQMPDVMDEHAADLGGAPRVDDRGIHVQPPRPIDGDRAEAGRRDHARGEHGGGEIGKTQRTPQPGGRDPLLV